MEDFTLGLALYDYLPGIISGVGLFFLAMITRRYAPKFAPVAYAGVGLVALAGFLKATWKLTVVLTGQDVVWLAESMFPLMGPGFLLVGVAYWAGVRGSRGKGAPGWLPLAAFALIGLAAAQVAFAGTLEALHDTSMMFASVANLTLTILLVGEMVRQGRWYLAPLFVVNIAMIFVLQGIANMETMSVAIHWLEQTITVVGAGAFAVGTYLLMRLITRPAPPEPTFETARAAAR
jgi:hypothetical protein